MKLYLAGKVTGDANYKFKFYNAAMWLRIAGYSVFDPTSHGLEEVSWLEAMRFVIPELLTCDGVAMLPNWRKSRGAKIEVYIARKLGMPCKTAHRWLKES